MEVTSIINDLVELCIINYLCRMVDLSVCVRCKISKYSRVGIDCYGDNTKAALITRGISEISRLGVAMGGKAETFAGLTGIGDLVVTCASMHSRNRRAGILIGQGKTMNEAAGLSKKDVGTSAARVAEYGSK